MNYLTANYSSKIEYNGGGSKFTGTLIVLNFELPQFLSNKISSNLNLFLGLLKSLLAALRSLSLRLLVLIATQHLLQVIMSPLPFSTLLFQNHNWLCLIQDSLLLGFYLLNQLILGWIWSLKRLKRSIYHLKIRLW